VTPSLFLCLDSEQRAGVDQRHEHGQDYKDLSGLGKAIHAANVAHLRSLVK
jgi:hypothetical protein